MSPSAEAGQDAREMPKYRSHKEVWALKIAHIESREDDGAMLLMPEESGYAPFWVNHAYVRRHNPQVGGYYVVYADGYKSWSPAAAFESGYTLISG